MHWPRFLQALEAPEVQALREALDDLEAENRYIDDEASEAVDPAKLRRLTASLRASRQEACNG